MIGLRDALMHDYLNLDAGIVEDVIRQRSYQWRLDFSETQLRET